MALEIPSLGLTYYPIPKSGSSSVKFVLMSLTGADTTVSNDPENWVHDHLYTNLVDPFIPLVDGLPNRFAIIRDPLERLLSVYSGRVLKSKVLAGAGTDREMAGLLKLPLDPDPDTFILNIEGYCVCSHDIRFHAAASRFFLGSSLYVFDRIFRFDQLDEVAAFLSRPNETRVELPQLQRSETVVTPADLSDRALAQAMRFCRHDYGFLVDYFDPARWGGIPGGDPREFSSLHAFKHPALFTGSLMTYPRTFRNFRNFLAKRELYYSK